MVILVEVELCDFSEWLTIFISTKENKWSIDLVQDNSYYPVNSNGWSRAHLQATWQPTCPPAPPLLLFLTFCICPDQRQAPTCRLLQPVNLFIPIILTEVLIIATNLLFSCFVQARIPHDDNDMHDRHVLPAGHAHRTGMEHVNCTCCTEIQRNCVTTPPRVWVHCNVMCNLTAQFTGIIWSIAAIFFKARKSGVFE